MHGLEIRIFFNLLCVCIFILGGSCISSFTANICDNLLLFSKVKCIRLSKACLHTLVMFVSTSFFLLADLDGTSD